VGVATEDVDIDNVNMDRPVIEQPDPVLMIDFETRPVKQWNV